MVDGDASLGHHLLQVPQAEAVSQIPSHAEQDCRAINSLPLNTMTSATVVLAKVGEPLKQIVATESWHQRCIADCTRIDEGTGNDPQSSFHGQAR